ncbi:MAG: Uma2 family endonuclease [Chloroflexota bacterium]
MLNPIVIFKVLSKSTEQYERGDKFEQYRSIGSLTDYTLVSQNRCRVEQYTRQPDGTWLYRAYANMSDTSQIESIDCELLLEDVYEKVNFADESNNGSLHNGNQP